jgi:uncharacterized iron-regulated membrane protein
MKKARIIRWAHRWVGLFFAVATLMASGSGLIHLWMSHTQPPPPTGPSNQAPVVDMSLVKISPQQAVEVARQQHQSEGVLRMELLSIKNEPWYQIFLQGVTKPVYVSAQHGQWDAERDEIYAQQIASSSIGGHSVRKTHYLSQFDREYIAIFRILPVYRFDADDQLGTRVYVSTVTGTVTRATDDQKQWEANVFSLFHKWMFIRDKNLRNYSLGLATLGVFLTSVLGIWLFWVTRRTPKKVVAPRAA